MSLEDYINYKMYDGVTPKVGITMDGIEYIVKDTKNDLDSSIYSEYVASHFINNLGFNSHETELYTDNTNTHVLIKDFTAGGNKLIKFEDTNQSSVDSLLSGKHYTYNDVIRIIEKHTKILNVQKKEVINEFWSMFFIDAIIGNRDRHKGNWGFLNVDGTYIMAPLYDQGSSLFPDVMSKLGEYISIPNSFILERCEKFPASLLCEELVDGTVKRTNFYYFINPINLLKYEGMSNSYNLFKSIGIELVHNSIRDACDNNGIPNILKDFYIRVVCARYLHIIERQTLDFVEDWLEELK